MRRTIIFIALAAAVAMPAAASAAPNRHETLGGRVSRLESVVGQQQQQIAQLQKAAIYNANYDICIEAINFDLFDLFAQALGATPQPRIDDKGTCAAIGINRGSFSMAGATLGIERHLVRDVLNRAWGMSFHHGT
jgi:hypothetical protein